MGDLQVSWSFSSIPITFCLPIYLFIYLKGVEMFPKFVILLHIIYLSIQFCNRTYLWHCAIVCMKA